MIEVVHHKAHTSSYFIARPSVLGNPFKLEKGAEKGSTLPKYKEYFYEQIESNNIIFIAELNKLVRLAKIDNLYLGCHCAPDACHGDIIKEFLEQELINPTLPQYKVLECSSKGDKRFSALYAEVAIFGCRTSIERHYQSCKRIEGFEGKNMKGKEPDYLIINGKQYDKKYLTPYYKLLWIRYLDQHPELVNYASQFDEFTDMFKGSSINCQADVIRQYVKEGRQSVMDDCQEFIQKMKEMK